MKKKIYTPFSHPVQSFYITDDFDRGVLKSKLFFIIDSIITQTSEDMMARMRCYLSFRAQHHNMPLAFVFVSIVLHL